MARRLLAACYDIDVADDLGRITAPTTVIHRRDDRAVPLAEGERLAAGIDGARLTVLAGRTHVPFVGDADSVLNAMRRGLGLPPLERRTQPTVTPRQLQVAALVAQGWSNRQIAEELVITERSAESHVERIRARLGFRSRAQIAAWYVATNPSPDALKCGISTADRISALGHARCMTTSTTRPLTAAARGRWSARRICGEPGSGPVQLGVLLGHGRLHQLAHAQGQGQGVRRPAAERGRTRLGRRREPALPAARRAPDRDRAQPLHARAAAARRAPAWRRSRDPHASSANGSTCPTPAPNRHLQPGAVHGQRPGRRPRRDPPDPATGRTVQLRRARRRDDRARRRAGHSGSCVARGRGSSRAVPANET